MNSDTQERSRILQYLEKHKTLPTNLEGEIVWYAMFVDFIYHDCLYEVEQTLETQVNFPIDQELIEFAQKHSPKIAALLTSKRVSPKVVPDTFSNRFSRLSLSALEEIATLYPVNSSQPEAIQFRKILADRQKQEAEAKKAIDFSVIDGSTRLLDSHLPLRASCFKYLLEKAKGNLVSCYLVFLYQLCEADDLPLNDVLEYYDLLVKFDADHKSEFSYGETVRFVLWQRHSTEFLSKVLEKGNLSILDALCRIEPSFRARYIAMVRPENVAQEYRDAFEGFKETDLGKLAQNCPNIFPLSGRGIRSKKELAHIPPGKQIFEKFRASLPDESPIVKS